MNAMPATVALCGSSRLSTRQPTVHKDATITMVMVIITITITIMAITAITATILVHPTLPTLPNMEGSMEAGVACRLASHTAI